MRILLLGFILFIGTGFVMSSMDPLGENHAFYRAMSIALELLLFGFAAYLALKWMWIGGREKRLLVYRLSSTSQRFKSFLVMGLLTAALFLWLQHKYHYLLSSDVLVFGLLLAYFLAQISLHRHPTLFLTARQLLYDHYELQRWKWEEATSIQIDDQRVVITWQEEVLDVPLMDEELQLQQELTESLRAGVIDAGITSHKITEEFLQTLRHLAKQHRIPLRE